MKRLTISHISAASIRANRRTYLSLAVGIFLAVFLATAVTVCAYGVVKAGEQEIIRKVGYAECVLMDDPNVTDQALRDSGLFSQIGRQYVAASVKGSDLYLGYMDEEAAEILCRSCAEGRLPAQAGEIAIERSALEKLRLEVDVGDSVTWTLVPVDGVEEEHTFTVVGILNEQSECFDTGFSMTGGQQVYKWPAALISPDEPFDTGRTAVHRVMTFAPLSGFSQIEKRYPYSLFFSVSRTQASLSPIDETVYDAQARLDQTAPLLLFGGALLLAVCIGIASAMESVLAQKTEEIGMLRAVGATKRQIRRIFGRDAWLLSLAALPVGIALGVLAAWALCRLSPERMLFSFRVWLLWPVLAVSALCVFLASAVPLRRAARQTPMGVLRDTALLRRAGGFRTKTSFRAPELIAGRQLRLHPWRQLGAVLMIMATLLCTALLGEVSYDVLNELSRSRAAAFKLYGGFTGSSGYDFAVSRPDAILSAQDIAQIRALPQVSQAALDATTNVNLIFTGDELPAYFLGEPGEKAEQSELDEIGPLGIFSGWGLDYLTITDADAPASGEIFNFSSMMRQMSWDQYQQMLAVMDAQQLEGKPITIELIVTDLRQVDYSGLVADGEVDLDAVDAGREVLVYAPDFYLSRQGGGYLTSPEVPRGGKVLMEYKNDYFTAGQTLHLVQLISDGGDTGEGDALREAYAGMERHDADVTAGAVLTGGPLQRGSVCIYTTEKGAEALGIPMTTISEIDVSLSSDVDLETEQALETRLTRIAMRGEMTVYNCLKSWRESLASMRETLLLISAVLVLFFAVTVAMQVGNAGRRIRADRRMIGTLRAVGADERALLGCYRLPVIMTAALGTALAVLGYLGYAAWYHGVVIPVGSESTWPHIGTVMPAMVILGALCALCCLAGLRARLRTVLDESIVENIREL